MAVYNGFFDAVQDEETKEYDRAYSAGDFTRYFEQTVGSGVCVHNDPDSFKVRLEGGKAVVSPGYLFIRGYWCRNDADYTIDLPGTGNYAIAAHLNLGTRMIELEARSVAQAYPDSLVLAIVSPTSAEDTRHNTDICGVIDTAGELSVKVEWAVNYIDNEIEGKLAAAEAEINAQSLRLDAKIAEVQAQVDRIAPPPVGSIKFSASKDVGAEWLKCDGSFVSEADYPELVAVLGKLTPSSDKFQLVSDGEIGPQITNGAICFGRMWVFSWTTRKLYGVDLEGTQPVVEITLTGDEYFGGWLQPSAARPLALSIVPVLSNPGTYKLCLAQFVGPEVRMSAEQANSAIGPSELLIYWSDFTGDEQSISMARPFVGFMSGNSSLWISCVTGTSIPYVTSRVEDAVDVFYCFACGVNRGESFYIQWSQKSEKAWIKEFDVGVGTGNDVVNANQILNFNKKSKNELLFIYQHNENTYAMIESIPDGYFTRDQGQFRPVDQIATPVPTNTLYGGNDFVVVNTSADVTKMAVISRNNLTNIETVEISNLSLPSAKRIFLDAGAYLWGKDIYMLFVGTGLIFSRDLSAGSFGYLDTTGVLGIISQFGYLDYSEDEGTLYILGQDTSNKVKVAKIILNTLYDYANDGAWLPMLASDGVPAYIKAKGEGGGGDSGGKVTMPIKVLAASGVFDTYADVLFNGEPLIAGTYTRDVDANSKFSAGLRIKKSGNYIFNVKMNGVEIVRLLANQTVKEQTVEFNVSDFAKDGITLQGFVV